MFIMEKYSIELGQNQPEKKDLQYYKKAIDQELKVTKKMVTEAIEKNGKLPEAIFDLRAKLYGLAMEMAGEARDGDLQTMHDLIKPQKGETSVDIAAGTGFLTQKLIEWTQGKTFAIDPSEKQLDILKEICPQAEVIVGHPEDREVFKNIPEGG